MDLRVPYIGYSSESESYTAAGVSAYNALQAHIEKRMNHGLQLGFSYTYSHSLDEQSGLGLFYNGNNPLNLRSGLRELGLRPDARYQFHVPLPISQLLFRNFVEGKIVDGWGVRALAIFQSGQPYSVIDYTGAVGSIFYGTSNGITNPIVPLAPGCTPKSALTGASGAYERWSGRNPGAQSQCFTLPLLAAGGGKWSGCDSFE